MTEHAHTHPPPGGDDPAPQVLIVDDEDAILRALRRELRGQDFRVTTLSDPLKALETVRRQAVALIISDNRMPGMTGIELLEQVKQASPDTVRIMLTGYTDMESAVNAVNKGEIHRFVTKPWERAQLLAHIHEGLELNRLRTQNQRLSRELRETNAMLASANDELRQLASRDPMTGLYNHGKFQAHLQRQLKLFARDRQPFCLALGDIDDFKRINDTYGHPAGDDVIKRMAGLISASLREEVDTTYRYGGEEFAVLLRNTTGAGAAHALARLLEVVRACPVEVPGGPLAVTMSFGCGQYRADQDADTFIARVDRALYDAKRSGKDRFVLLDGQGSNGAGNDGGS